MPTYLYECRQCGKVFETDQRITEDPLKDCDCGGEGTLKRLIQPTAILFKGDGFFINDATKQSPTKSATPEEKPAETAEATPAKPTESPAATSESKPDAKD